MLCPSQILLQIRDKPTQQSSFAEYYLESMIHSVSLSVETGQEILHLKKPTVLQFFRPHITEFYNLKDDNIFYEMQ